MSQLVVTTDQVMAKARQRPPGYVDDLKQCAKSIKSGLWVFDTQTECWQQMLVKYRPRAQWSVGRKGASRGVGDTIAKLTSAVGIKPCGGCKKRQAKLNELLPYSSRR